VDLTRQKIWVEPTPKELLSKYMGGRGVNAKYLWDLGKPKADPLSPENPLIFGTGLFNGTFIPTASQLTITSKSPATNLYCKSNAGGHWAVELGFAGYNHLVVIGASKKPTFLLIQDDLVETRSASHLWGKDVRETNAILTKDTEEGAQVACIGPAGENLVKFACIMVSTYHAAGRGGLGAVMGSKRLKAIAVRGTKEQIKVADPEALRNAVVRFLAKVPKNAKAQIYYKYGTTATLQAINEASALPSYNFRETRFEQAYKIDGDRLVELGYIKGMTGCTSCPINCHRYSVVGRGKYRGYSGGPEYETLASFGAGCGVENLEAIMKANELCNLYGLDTISTGGVIQWAMECYEKGVITKSDTDGLELDWGNDEVVIELISKIAHRQGFGNILAEGTKIAADHIGRGSWKWAVQAKGLEQSRVDTRSAKAYALAFAVNPRGPDHLHASPMAEFGFYPESRELVKKLTGSEKYADPHVIDKKAEIVRWHEDYYALTEVLGLCTFATITSHVLTPEILVEFFQAFTGEKTSEEKLMLVGRRVVTLERCLNVREGLMRKDDVLPWRLMNEPVTKGPQKGLVNSRDELDAMLDRYYELHGWDKNTGIPTYETLQLLGIGDIGKELFDRSIPPVPKRFNYNHRI
jgi:aldehyde:ferredoxin oxidoreductase